MDYQFIFKRRRSELMERSNPKLFLFLSSIILLIIASLGCNFTDRFMGSEASEKNEELIEALNAEVVDDRPEIMEFLGVPDAFDISIVEVEGVKVRLESWRYYQFGTRVDFVDGEAVWTVEIEPLPDGTICAAWYDPLAFEIGMTAAEAIQLASAASPAGFVPELVDLSEGGEDLLGGSVLVGDQITIGLYGDQVVYVETYALAPEGGQQ
jgi:hypothetical protein